MNIEPLTNAEAEAMTAPTTERVKIIDELVASGRFTDQDRNALFAMKPETLRVLARDAGPA